MPPGKCIDLDTGLVHASDRPRKQCSATKPAKPLTAPHQTDGESGDATQHRDHDGRQCLGKIVGDGDARGVGQHRHEVQRPHAYAELDGSQCDPEHALPVCSTLRVAEQDYRGETGKHADEYGKRDEPQVMLGRHTFEETEHFQRPESRIRLNHPYDEALIKALSVPPTKPNRRQ